MKIANDIRQFIEEDSKDLTLALLSGEISIEGISLSALLSEDVIAQLSSDIISYQLENKMLSRILPCLATMRWLTLQEACIYSRKSRNTLLKLIEEMKIYGTKAEGGDYVVDRESIDAYYNEEREDLKEKLRGLRRASA